jgi:hypothetical protein
VCPQESALECFARGEGLLTFCLRGVGIWDMGLFFFFFGATGV